MVKARKLSPHPTDEDVGGINYIMQLKRKFVKKILQQRKGLVPENGDSHPISGGCPHFQEHGCT